LDANIKKSKSQYQIFKTRKLSFEASDLSKHLIKNLQSTINVLIDKEDNKEEEDTEKVLKPSIQKKPIEHSFSGGFSKSNKRKGKDTEDQSNSNRNRSSGREGDDDSSSSSDKEDPNPRKS